MPFLLRLAATPGDGRRPSPASLLAVWTRGDVRHALTVTFLFQAANLGAYTYLGALLTSAFHLKVGTVGLVGVLVGVGSVAGSIAGGRLAAGRRPRALALLLALCSVLLGGAVLLVAESSVPALSVFAVLCWFVASGAFVTGQQTLLVITAPELRATAVSWNNTTMYVGTAAGVWLVGLFGHVATGLAAAGTLLAALSAGNGLLLARHLTSGDER